NIQSRPAADVLSCPVPHGDRRIGSGAVCAGPRPVRTRHLRGPGRTGQDHARVTAPGAAGRRGADRLFDAACDELVRGARLVTRNPGTDGRDLSDGHPGLSVTRLYSTQRHLWTDGQT